MNKVDARIVELQKKHKQELDVLRKKISREREERRRNDFSTVCKMLAAAHGNEVNMVAPAALADVLTWLLNRVKRTNVSSIDGEMEFITRIENALKVFDATNRP